MLAVSISNVRLISDLNRNDHNDRKRTADSSVHATFRVRHVGPDVLPAYLRRIRKCKKKYCKHSKRLTYFEGNAFNQLT